MPTYYCEDEYKNILAVSRNEHYTVIPNEIFDEINNIKKEINLIKDSKHISFAFSYLYLVTYLYRYAKFHDNKEYEFTEQELKKLLTMSPDSYGKKSVTSIIKRGGILEKFGFIKKVRDYPISYDYDPEEKEFVFSYISDVIADLGENAHKYFNINSKNRRVNLPLKMFDDREVKAIDMECRGTLYDVTYTTQIDIRVFIYCMIREKLGLEAFYLYSFIKYKNNSEGSLWRRSIAGIIEDTGLSQKVIQSRLKEMEQHRMLICTHEDYILGYVVGDNKDEIMPNGYMINEYHMFINKDDTELPYKRGRVISGKVYFEENNVK